MALSKVVEESLREAESNLRNALAYSARTERPVVNTSISEMIFKIESIISMDSIMDKLENRKFGDKGRWGISFDE